MTPLRETIIHTLETACIPLATEKAAQDAIAALFAGWNCSVEREYRIDQTNVIDFRLRAYETVGVEVKVNKGQKRAILNQVRRYAESGQFDAIILATNKAIGLPRQIDGADLYVISLGKGWL